MLSAVGDGFTRLGWSFLGGWLALHDMPGFKNLWRGSGIKLSQACPVSPSPAEEKVQGDLTHVNLAVSCGSIRKRSGWQRLQVRDVWMLVQKQAGISDLLPWRSL